jgi:phosphate transport system protein
MMTMRVHYEEDLAALNREILKMALLAEKSIEKAMNSLREKRRNLADQVLEEDSVINRMENDLGDRVALIIAREQPVATELRKLIGAIKIITDIERIGDYAVHIARRYDDLSQKNVAPFMPRMCEMADIGMTMVRDSVAAFVEDDMEKALEVAGRDAKIDNMHYQMFMDNMNRIKDEDDYLETGVSLLFTSRFLERLGDHVKNICEWVIFAVNGEHKDL